MTSSWTDFLTSKGALFAQGSPSHFGDAASELAGSTGDVVTDLSHLGLIAFSGEDTPDFLQGQLTNDVRKLSPHLAQFSGHCTPKGRLLANFLLWMRAGDVFMQLPSALAEPIRKRLSMFILRSRVKARDAQGEVVRLGVSGPGAGAAVTGAGGTIPGTDMGVGDTGDLQVVRLSATRYEILAPIARGPELWDALTRNARPVGFPVWEWIEIRAGVPTILPATQEQFVPQMVNYELVGGVSFQKGCYPGQEIVARTHYLGKIKRRMYLAHADGPEPRPGDELFTPDMEGQATGMVVNVRPAPSGGYDLLAVIQQSSAELHPVRLKSLQGPELKLDALPYSVT